MNSTKRPATIRSESVCEKAQGDLSPELTKNKKKDKHEDSERAREDPLSELPPCVQEFRENLADERIPE